MASVTIDLTGLVVFSSSIIWPDDVLLGSVLDRTGQNQTFSSLELAITGLPGRISLNLAGANDRFTDNFEMNGRLRIVASDGETLTVTGGLGGDMSEPYSWTPSNSAEVIAFANHVAELTNQNATLTLQDTPFTTEPAQPDAPSLTVASRSSITVGFTDPDDGGSAITSRNMRYRQTGTATWVTLISQTFPRTITGLSFATEYDFQVQAVNAEGNSDWSDTATATTSANQAPTVSITTSSQVINGNSTLALAATASDPESDSITYLWSANIGSFTDGDTLNATYNAPAPTTSNQAATLTLTVTDEHGAETERTLGLTIRLNQAPSVTILTPNSIVASGADVGLQSTISDVDHPLSDLTILWSGSGTFDDTATDDPTWTAPAVTEETDYVLTLSVDDGVADAVVRTVTMTVKPPLLLSDYDQTGKVFDVLALIEAGAPNDIFQQSPLTARGSVLEGDIGIGPDDTYITRIRMRLDGAQIIIREADLTAGGTSAPLDIFAYLGDGGDGNDLNLDIMTLGGSFSTPVAGNFDSAGNSAVQVRLNVPSGKHDILDDIGAGDRFIIAFWREAGEFDGDASAASWEIEAGSATGQAEYDGDASAASWEFTVPSATGTGTIPDSDGDASPASWEFAVPAATGESTEPDYDGDAVAANWEIEASSATGQAEYSGNAVAATWEFEAPAATGAATVPENSGNASAATWTMDVPSATGLAEYSGDASAATWEIEAASAVGTAVAPGNDGNASPASWAFDVPSATGTGLAPLTLADFELTGLVAEWVALLRRTETGTTWYADSDRSGTDSPVDGDMGFGASTFSRINLLANDILRLNDNDNPGVEHMGAFFNSGGDGDDVTIWAQAAGLERQSIEASAILNNGANGGQFTTTQAFRDVLNSIGTGELWIFAGTRGQTQHDGNASAATWEIEAASATGQAQYDGDASAASWSVDVPSATGAALAPGNDGNAVAANWEFDVPAATGQAEYSGDASAASWEFEAASATGQTTVADASGNAVAASWEFEAASATGQAAYAGDASEESWTFVVPSASGAIETDTPDQVGQPTLAAGEGSGQIQVEYTIQVRTTGSGQEATVYVTGMRLANADELLDWDERGRTGFSKVST